MAQKRGLEVSLSLVAAVGGTLAAVGGFVIAYHQMSRDEIERSPAVHLACRPEYRLAEIAQGIAPPEETLLLTERGGQWVHVGGKLKGVRAAAAPEPFARCTVRNFARLPVLNIRIPLRLSFSAPGTPGPIVKDAVVEIPGLAPDASWEFSMLNGTSKNLKFAFDRSISVTRVDERKQVTATLFTDERVAELERASAAATVVEAPPATSATFLIRGFAFKPNELHVKAGETVIFDNRDDEAHAIVSADHSLASGALNPHSVWRHAFAKPGRYALHCDYHPYMEAVVVVD